MSSFFPFLLASRVGVAGGGGTRPCRGVCGLLLNIRALGRERGLSGRRKTGGNVPEGCLEWCEVRGLRGEVQVSHRRA